MKPLVRFVLICLLFGFNSTAWAVSGDLGVWLKYKAGPSLSQLIKTEPRFIGETIDFVGLRNGLPGPLDTALAQDVGDEVRRILLNTPGIRVPLNANSCEVKDEGVALAIEIVRLDRSQHRITLALLDLDESIWINRSVQTWSGRLNSSQYQRLAQQGSSWTSAYSNTESDSAGCHSVAMNEVTEIKAQEPRRLISDITMSQRKVECRGHGKACVDIEYEALDDSFVFEFFTMRGRIVALAAGERPVMRYGENRKGLKVPQGQHPDRPSLGYYVFATRNPMTAAAVSDFLSDCNGTSLATDTQLEQLGQFANQPEIQWQAIHLNNYRGRISRL